MTKLSGVYTSAHVRRTCTPYRCTAYMYASVNTALATRLLET